MYTYIYIYIYVHGLFSIGVFELKPENGPF